MAAVARPTGDMPTIELARFASSMRLPDIARTTVEGVRAPITSV